MKTYSKVDELMLLRRMGITVIVPDELVEEFEAKGGWAKMFARERKE